MERKLRNKFTLYSVLAAFIVIVMIFGSITLGSYLQVVSRSDLILDILMKNGGDFPEADEFQKFVDDSNKLSSETPFSTRFFYVKYLDDSKNYRVDIGKVFSISEKQALSYSAKVLEKKSERGFINQYRFYQKDQSFGKLQIFVDASRDLDLHHSLVYTGGFISFAALIAVAAVAKILSQKAVKPIIEGYERQKQFITDASHELKTPLAIIKTNAEVLTMTTSESKWLKNINNQVNRLNFLIESLLNLAELDETTKKNTKVEISLSDIVIEIAQGLELLAEREQKRLILEVQSEIRIKGNEEAISKLVSILIENAIKYSIPKSDILVTLKRQDRKIIFQTKNEASDLMKGNYNKLFERFYREDSSRNSQKGGHGIGLTIAKSIVEQQLGTISANSPDGKTLEIRVVIQEK